MDYTLFEDGELLQRFATTGDDDAFQTLYDRFHSELHGFLFKSCPVSPSEINDILQDVWTMVVRKANLYDPEQSVRNWLYRITERVAIDAQRAKNYQKRGGPEYQTFNMNEEEIRHCVEDRRTGQSVENPLQALLDGEQREHIQEIVDQLPNGERQAVNLVYLEGLTLDEAAETLDILMHTVGKQLSRARLRLKRMLSDLVQN